MINAVLDIKLLKPDEWPVLRTVRLRALGESPHAFMARYEDEARLSAREWRQRLVTAVWAVAVESGEIIGLAGLVEGQQPHMEKHVESIWVAPTHRCRGVFRSLLAALADEARRTCLLELPLWVLEDNKIALLAYSRLGFVATGERQAIDSTRNRFERRLRLAL